MVQASPQLQSSKILMGLDWNLAEFGAPFPIRTLKQAAVKRHVDSIWWQNPWEKVLQISPTAGRGLHYLAHLWNIYTKMKFEDMGGFHKCQTRICPQWQNGVYSGCHLFTPRENKVRVFFQKGKYVEPVKLVTTLTHLWILVRPLS